MKEVDIDFIVKEVTTSSINSGYEFGDVKRIPKVEDLSAVGQTKCENENCTARMYVFRHVISKQDGDATRYDEFRFAWNPSLDKFELEGEYCPVCEYTEVRIDNELRHENEGIELVPADE